MPQAPHARNNSLDNTPEIILLTPKKPKPTEEEIERGNQHSTTIWGYVHKKCADGGAHGFVHTTMYKRETMALTQSAECGIHG